MPPIRQDRYSPNLALVALATEQFGAVVLGPKPHRPIL